MVLAGMAAVGLTTAALAQETLVIGPRGGPGVEVDLGALDQLPSRPTLPELLRGRPLTAFSASGRQLPLSGEKLSRVRPHQGARRAFLAAPRRPIPPMPSPTAAAPREFSAKTSPTTKKNDTAAASTVPAKPTIAAAPAIVAPPKVKITAPVPPPPKPKIVARQAKPAPTKVAKAPKPQKPPAPPKITASAPKPPKANPPAAPKPPTTIASAPATIGDALSVAFPSGQSELSSTETGTLNGVIKELNADQNKRVQLMAYAAAPDGNSSKARRLSLSRALSVRSYLMSKGIRSTRMDVRALGDRSKTGPADRVDVIVVTR